MSTREAGTTPISATARRRSARQGRRRRHLRTEGRSPAKSGSTQQRAVREAGRDAARATPSTTERFTA